MFISRSICGSDKMSCRQTEAVLCACVCVCVAGLCKKKGCARSRHTTQIIFIGEGQKSREPCE